MWACRPECCFASLSMGRRTRGAPRDWRYELRCNASAPSSAKAVTGSKVTPRRQLAQVTEHIDEEALSALAPQVSRERVRALLFAAGDDVQGVIDQLLALSASLADGNEDGPSVGSSAAIPQHDSSGSQQSAQTPFGQLPNEVLNSLLARVATSALASLSLTCKEAQNIVSTYLGEIKSISQPSQLRNWSNRRCLSLFRRVTSMRHLELSALGLRGSQLLLDAFELPVLQQLDSLQISYAGKLDKRDAVPPAEDALAEVLYELPTRLHQLKALMLIDCPVLNDSLASRLANMSSLTHLCLNGNQQISQECIQCLLNRPTSKLKIAQLAFCGDRLQARRAAGVSIEPPRASPSAAAALMGIRLLTDPPVATPLAPTGVTMSAHVSDHDSTSDAKLTKAEEINQAESEAEASAMAAFATAISGVNQVSARALRINRPPTLTTLSLRGWSRIMLLQIDLVELHELNLAQATSLSILHLRTPRLETLNTTGCRELQKVYLCRCTSLRDWSSAQCKSLYVILGPSVSRLQTLNLFGCRQIAAEPIRQLLRSSCSTLRRLDLNGAIRTSSLAEADLRCICPYLEALDCKGRTMKY